MRTISCAPHHAHSIIDDNNDGEPNENGIRMFVANDFMAYEASAISPHRSQWQQAATTQKTNHIPSDLSVCSSAMKILHSSLYLHYTHHFIIILSLMLKTDTLSPLYLLHCVFFVRINDTIQHTVLPSPAPLLLWHACLPRFFCSLFFIWRV